MANLKTGSETLAYCTSCKMDLGAVIVAMSGAQVLRVMCKTCKKERGYKPAKGVKEPGAQTPKTASGSSTRTKTPAEPKASAVAVAVEWKNHLDKAISKQAKRASYIPKELYTPGEIVDHPSFGPGVVTKLVHPNKIEILFQNDLKVLVHGLGAR